MTDRPHDPTSGVKPAARPRGEPPPRPPRELERDEALCRAFHARGIDWLARPAGRGAGGTGSYGLGMIQAIHFFRAADPATPLLEALLPAGRFAALYDEELGELLERAREIVEAREPGEVSQRRGRRRSD